MKKYCSKCKNVKSIEEFGKNKNKDDGLQSFCKSCRNSYHKKYHEKNYKNNADYKKRKEEYYKKYKTKLKTMRSNFLSGKCCIDCGESDPIVLEFDHIIESEKCFNIADAIAHNYSEKSLIEEMDKCEIRCANCHRRRHYFNNAGKWSG